MAKRKKLNKRVAILLGAMGAVLIALVVTVGIKSNLWDRFFPKDPELFVKQARAALKQKQYDPADEAFRDAIGAGVRARSPRLKEYYLEYSRMCLEWAKAGTGLTRTQQSERFGKAVGLLRNALRHDAGFIEARQDLCTLFWEVAGSRASRASQRDWAEIAQGWSEYVKEADELLKLTPKDHQTCFRRGVAKGILSQGIDGQFAKDALVDMNRAMELKEDEPGYWLGMIGLLARLPGRDAEVDESYQRAVEANPKDATVLIAYANYLRQKSNPEAARKRLEEAIKKDPLLGNLAVAELDIRQGKLDEALAAVELARKADPRDARPYLRESSIYSRQNKPDQAVAILKEGVEVVEKVAATQPAGAGSRRLGTSRVELYYELTNVLLDTAERTKSADRQPVMAEIKQYMGKMQVLNLPASHRAKTEGRIAFLEGRLDVALEQLERAHQMSRRFDLKTANLLIGIYLARNLPGKAEQILNQLLRIPGQMSNPSALLAKARLRMSYRDYDRAEPYITRVLQVDPNSAEAMNMKLVIEAVGSDTPSLPTGLKPDARTVGLLLQRGVMLWMDGRREEAVKYVEQLHEKVPDSKSVIARLSYLYSGSGRAADAEKLLAAAVKKFPEDKAMKGRLELLREKDPVKRREILLKVADELPPLRRELEKATIWATLGDQAKYLEHVQAAAKIDPDSPEVVERLFRHGLRTKNWNLAAEQVTRARKGNLDGCEGRLFDARLAIIRGELDAGIAKLLDVLKIRSTRKDAHVLLGQAYLQKKLYDQAFEAFKGALDVDPAYARALVGLAAVTGIQGKMEEHREYIERAYQLIPHDPYVRGRHLAFQDDAANPEDIIARRKRDRQLRPDDLQNLLSLGVLYERTGKLAEAEEALADFNDREPDKLRGARVLGAFYLRRGRVKDMERVVKPLLDTWNDMVGVRILYGQLLTPVDPTRAKTLFEQAVAIKVNDPRGHLALARLWASQGDWPKAVDSMTKYVRLSPDNRSSVKELIRYGIEAAEYKLALERLDEILRDDPTDATALTLKGVVVLRQNKMEEATALFTQAIQIRPDYAEPLVYRAQMHLARNEPTKARADLQVAKRLSNRVDVAMQLAAIYQGMRDYDNAELVYKEVRAGQRTYQPAIDQLISIYLRRQKWPALQELLDEALKAFPDSNKYLRAVATMWEARGDEPKKLDALGKALKAAPGSIATLRTYLVALQQAGRFGELVSATDPYIDSPTVAPWVSAIRATALSKLKQEDLAEKFFLRCFRAIGADYSLLAVDQVQRAYGMDGAKAKAVEWLKAEPRNWRLYLLLGVLNSETESLPEALAALGKVSEHTGEPLAKFLASRHMGSVHYRLKDYLSTEKAYLACLDVRPNDIQVLNNLAYLYTNDLNQPKKALPHVRTAVRLRPGNARILDTYGWTLARLGQLADAEGILRKTVGVDEPLAASRYHLGWVYEQQRRHREAQTQYLQGFEMLRTKPDDPLHRVLKEALERVRRKLNPGSTKE
jgi:tetratricopeptide (TPR) repeat protein